MEELCASLASFLHIISTCIKILKGTNTHHNGHTGKKIKTEIMVEIYSNSLVRAIGKVLLMKFC